jgi:hypothetical protein
MEEQVQVLVSPNCSAVTAANWSLTPYIACLEDPDPMVLESGGVNISYHDVALASITTAAGTIKPAIRLQTAFVDCPPGTTPPSQRVLPRLACLATTVSIQALDFEDATHPKAAVLHFNTTDYFSITPNSTNKLSFSLQFQLHDMDDPPVLSVLQPVITFDETDGPVNGTKFPIGTNSNVILVSDPDITFAGALAINLTCISPPDGSPALNYLSCKDMFRVVCTQASTYVLANLSTQTRFGIVLAPNISLQDSSAKVIQVQVQAMDQNYSMFTSNTGMLSVHVTRRNNPVNASVVGLRNSQGIPTVTFRVNESSFPGTIVGNVTAFDADANQALGYTILSEDSQVPGTFNIRPVFVTYTHGTSSVRLARGVEFYVAVDALDFDDGQRVHTFLIKVEDDAQFNSTDLPAVNTTTATFIVKINVTDIPDTPVVLGISNVPTVGLQAAGQQTVILTGLNFGLSAGPASIVSGYYSNSIRSYNFTSCVVTTRLTAVACVTNAGQGYNYKVVIRVGTQLSSFSSAMMSYQSPTVTNVLVSPNGIPTTGGYVDISGFNFPTVMAEVQDLQLQLGAYGNTAVTGCVVLAPQTQLRCWVGAGAGRNQGLYVNASGIIVPPAQVSFSYPIITQVLTTAAATRGGDLVYIYGSNFGTVALNAVDWVQYQYFGCNSSIDITTAYRGACGILSASNCSVVVDHTTVRCRLAPGYGGPFSWQVSIAGLVSAWSNATTYYDPPGIDSIVPVEAATYTPSTWWDANGMVRYFVPTVGRTMLRVHGMNFGSSQAGILITIGARVFIYPEVTSVNTSTAFVIAPPSYGNTSISVTVGNSTAVAFLRYTAMSISGMEWFAGDLASAVRAIKVSGAGFSLCALCPNATSASDACIGLDPLLGMCATRALQWPDFQVTIDDENAVVTEMSADATSFVFSTRLLVGLIVVRQGNESISIDYNFTQLVQSQPMIKGMSPTNGWPCKGGLEIVLSLDNAGSFGSVIIDTEAGTWQCPPVWDSWVFRDSVAGISGVLVHAYNVSTTAKFVLLGSDEILHLSDDGHMARALKLQEANADYLWLYHVGSDTWYPRPRVNVTCYVTFWRGSAIGQGHEVRFISPPWHGSVTVRVIAAGRSSLNSITAQYAIPQLTTKAVPTVGGDTQLQLVTITGANFGTTARLVDLWFTLWDPVFHSSALDSASAVMAYENEVHFLYTGLADAGRSCRVVAWTDSTIRCFAPEGVADTLNNIIVTLMHAGSPSASIPNEMSVFTYGSARISSISPLTGPTRGAFPVTVRGTNFGRLPLVSGVFNPVPTSEQGVWQDTAYDIPPTDASAGGRWTVTVVVKTVFQAGAVQGLVAGMQDSSSLTIEITEHTHNKLTFIIPPYEGQVAVSLIFTSQAGTKHASLNDIIISAQAPVITAISALNDAINVNADPCAALVDWQDGGACLAQAWAVSPWPNWMLSDTRPCVRSINAIDSPLHIKIKGYNFGSGALAPSAALGDVACGPVDDRLGTIFIDNTTLLCAVTKSVPRRSINFVLSIAFSNTTSANSGILVEGTCPCGYYTDETDPSCKPCVAGASCRGVGDKPRALKGFWETVPAEWEAARNLIPAANVPPFVVCAVPELCTADRTCRNGSTGWMCVDCTDGTARGYDQTCDACEDTLALQAAVPVGVIVALALLVVIKMQRSRKSSLIEQRSRAVSTSNASDKEAANAARTEGKPSTIAMVKMGITYIQTLGVLSAYTRRQNLTAPSVGLVPDILRQMQFGADLGISSHGLQCAFPVDFYWKQWVAVALPLISVVIVPLSTRAYSVLARTVCARCEFPLHDDITGKRSRIIAGSAAAISTLLVLPIAITTAARLQLCASESEGYFLIANPAVSCSHPAYSKLAVASFILGYLYMLFPIVVGVLLFFRVSRVTVFFSFFLNGYDTNGHRRLPRAWESIVLLRKALLTSISTGFLGLQDIRSQLLLTMLLLALSFAMHISVIPYKAATTNILEGVALLGEITFGFAMMSRLASSSQSTIPIDESFAFDLVAVVLNFPFAAAYVFFLIDHVFGYRMSTYFASSKPTAFVGNMLRKTKEKSRPRRPATLRTALSVSSLQGAKILRDAQNGSRRSMTAEMLPALAGSNVRHSVSLQQGSTSRPSVLAPPLAAAAFAKKRMTVAPAKTTVTLQPDAEEFSFDNTMLVRASQLTPNKAVTPGPSIQAVARRLQYDSRMSVAPKQGFVPNLRPKSLPQAKNDAMGDAGMSSSSQNSPSATPSAHPRATRMDSDASTDASLPQADSSRLRRFTARMSVFLPKFGSAPSGVNTLPAAPAENFINPLLSLPCTLKSFTHPRACIMCVAV